MANGKSGNGDGGGVHPAAWPVLVGLGGLILGVGGSVIWVGGALRQIDINTKRIDNLEQFGSPVVQAIKADLQSAHVTLSEVARQAEKSSEVNSQQSQELARLKLLAEHMLGDFRTREFWEERAGKIAATEEAIKQLTQDVRIIEEFGRATAEKRAVLAAQLAELEGKLSSDEKAFNDLVSTVRRLSDDLAEHTKQGREELQEHQRQDVQTLRDEVNQLRAAKNHDAAK